MENVIAKAEVAALQLLAQAGRIDVNADWTVAAGEAGDFIIRLAEAIIAERKSLNPTQPNFQNS